MMKQDRKRKWAVFAILFPALLLSLLQIFPAFAFADDNIELGTPVFWQDDVDNIWKYSVYAYNGRTGIVDRHYISFLRGVGAYSVYRGISTPLFDYNSSAYGSSWLSDSVVANTYFTVINGDGQSYNTRFIYDFDANADYSTYLVVYRLLYDNVDVPNYDCYFTVSWEYDYFWNDDRSGAEELSVYLNAARKPMLRFHNGGYGTIYYADPATVVITNTRSRSWNVTAYFRLSTAELTSITGGDSFQYMQVIIPYPAMLPGTGFDSRIFEIDALTNFPKYYNFIGTGQYSQDLEDIKNGVSDVKDSIDGLTHFLEVSSPADDEKVEDMQEQRSAYDEALADYERNSNWVEVGAGNLINLQLDPNLIPEEAEEVISIIGVFANNPWLAPLIMAGLSFMLIRVIMIGVG